MGAAVEGHEHGEVTLVFTLRALKQFEAPAAVIADAREWSRYVGIVDRDAESVDSFVETHDLDPEFDLGEEDKWLTMERLRETTGTPRHVFVGTTDGDRTIATHLDWEFRTVTEVAKKAGWQLDGDQPGLLERLRTKVASLLAQDSTEH